VKNREILFIIKLRNEARRQFRGLNTDMKALARSAQNASKGIDQVSRSAATASRVAKTSGASFQNLGSRLQRVRQFALFAATALATIGVGVGIGKLLQDFAAFDKGLIGVSKTTNITGEELKALGVEIQQISRVVPESAERLLSIAQAAGQLGVNGAANIVKFTKTVGKLGLASNLAGEEAATALARILTVSGEPIENVDRLAAAIVDLGNNFAANERQIAGAALRVARATAQFGVGAADVAGIGTALVAVGVQAEEGGTVIQRAFQGISDAIRKGGEELQVLQDITGQTGEALKTGFDTDPTAVFQALIEGLGRINKEGGSVAGALEALGLEGVRVIGTLGTLAVRSEVLGKALQASNAAFKENTALDIEAARAAEAFSAQMLITTNAIAEAGVVLGEELAPFLLEVAKNFREFILEAKKSGDLAGFFGGIVTAIKLVAENFGTLLIVAGAFIALKIGSFLLGVGGGAIKAAGGMGSLSLATLRASAAFKGLLKVFAFGFIILAITEAVELFGKFNEEVADGVDTFSLFGAAVVGIFSAIGDSISNVLGGLGKFIDAIAEAATGNFAAAVEAVKAGLEQLGDTDIDIGGAIREQFKLLAIEARERGKEAGDALDEGLTNAIIRNAPAARDAGNKVAKAVVEGFLDGLAGFKGGREAFDRELSALVEAFRPGIAAARAQARQLDVLNLALLAGESRLKKFGLTQAEVKKLIDEVTASQKVALTVFQQELLNIEQRTALLGKSNEQKIVERGLQRATNAATKAGIPLKKEEIAILREKLELEAIAVKDDKALQKRVEAQKSLNISIGETIARLKGQTELIGLTGNALERETILIGFRNQATKDGIDLDEEQIARLKEQIELTQKARKEFSQNPFLGVKAGFKEFIDEARDLNTQFKDFTKDSIDSLKDNFNEFIATGKFNFQDFQATILNGLQEIATNKIFAELGAGLFGDDGGAGLFGGLFSGGSGDGGGGGGLLSGLGGILTSFFNKGGTVGKDGSPGIVPAAAFANAKRMQSGGPVSGRGKDTVPIFASPGEIVLNEDQARVLRAAVAGRGVGALIQPGDRGNNTMINDSMGGMNVSVTVVVQGVQDVASFQKSSTQVAASIARATNRALQRNG